MRRIALPFGLAVAALAPLGCTTWEGGVPGYFKNRVRDALDMADLGVTVTTSPQFAFYAAFMSIAPGGYGRVDGTFVGIGGGDIGTMRIRYDHIGLLVWGRERVGWGSCIWDFQPDVMDPQDPDTWDRQGVGVLGILLPPYDARPAGRPT